MKYLVDTGAFVALFSNNDAHHLWAINIFDTIPRNQVYTCEPVITETIYLLGKRASAVAADRFAEFLEQGIIRVDFTLAKEITRLREQMQRYRTVPMDLADACLVIMSENTEVSTILTTDKDFFIYRRNGKQMLNLLTPYW